MERKIRSISHRDLRITFSEPTGSIGEFIICRRLVVPTETRRIIPSLHTDSTQSILSSFLGACASHAVAGKDVALKSSVSRCRRLTQHTYGHMNGSQARKDVLDSLCSNIYVGQLLFIFGGPRKDAYIDSADCASASRCKTKCPVLWPPRMSKTHLDHDRASSTRFCSFLMVEYSGVR